MAATGPRRARSSASPAASTSRPATRTVPVTSAPVPRCRPRSPYATVLLPEPDSPTMPSAPPGGIVKESPSTARTAAPWPTGNVTERSATSTSGSAIC